MSFKKKYLHPIFMYLVVYIFGFLFLSVGTTLARYAYTYMNYLFPRVFPLFSPVSEKEAYAKYLTLLAAIGILTAIWLINYFALRFDNSKFEFMVKMTDGQYTLKKGFAIFIGEFGISEIIVSTILPLVFVFPAYLIPDFGFIHVPVLAFLANMLERIFWLGFAFKEYFGIVNAIIITLLFSVSTRLFVIPGALNKWRASWLSGAVQ